MLWADFLETTPPNSTETIDDLYRKDTSDGYVVTNKDIQLHRNSEKCNGTRFFQPINLPRAKTSQTHDADVYICYWCRNCQFNTKTYALKLKPPNTTDLSGKAMKYGEYPTFGPPVPARVISLIGPDRDNFLRGRRAENQGLGIGAFAYYRRVVENQKGRIIDEIGKVAKRLGTTEDIVAMFECASKETQFSKSIDNIKSAIPQTLLIDGHNPLMLLHSALSEGLHAGTDEECLEMATSIRVVLTELSERISIVLKDDSELKQAVNNLMRPRANSSSET